MYSGYTTQQTLQDERVRDLIANAAPETSERSNPLARFFAGLHDKLTVAPEATAIRTHATECRQASA